jgi:predicted amidohydrolase YtcJ
MRLRHKQARPALVALALACAATAHATTIIDNANGYTLTAKGDVVQFAALALDDAGRIVAVGSVSDVAAQVPQARHVDMAGRTVLPGLIDAHGHVFGLGEMPMQLDLSATTSLPQALAAIRDYARGRGWNQENWKLGRFPTARELDGAVADRPVWLERVDGHAGWANGRALALAGITDTTPATARSSMPSPRRSRPITARRCATASSTPRSSRRPTSRASSASASSRRCRRRMRCPTRTWPSSASAPNA